MRTSRISRETARIASAMSPAKARSTTLRRTPAGDPNEALGIDEPSDIKQHDAESDSALLQPTGVPSAPSGTFALGKRKRGTASSSSIKPSLEETTIRRRSQRKPTKQEERTVVSKTPVKTLRQPAKRITGRNGETKTEPPPNWEQMYSITAEMRKLVLAPVDTMGCESLAEEDRSPRDKRLQTLIALMLSSQTKDTVNAAAIKNLQQNLPGGLNLESLLAVEAVELNRLIEKVGFHNNKTKYIKATSIMLRDNFASDIPDTIDGLVSLPGVGPKMAYLTMSAAWGRDEGIGVDVHVHRITNLWGWHKTSTPEQTRAELESWLPKEKWHDINHLLVGFGQTICLPIGRRCGECELSKGFCPSAVAGSPTKRRVKAKIEVELEGGVKREKTIKVEVDDVSVRIEADLPVVGNIELQAMAGAPLANLEAASVL